MRESVTVVTIGRKSGERKKKRQNNIILYFKFKTVSSSFSNSYGDFFFRNIYLCSLLDVQVMGC